MRIALALLALAAASCNGDDGEACGPPEEAGTTIVAAIAAGDVTFGEFLATHARDCGEESTTIDGTQVDPAPLSPTRLTLCIARGDLIGAEPIDLGDLAAVPQVDVSAEANGCIYLRDFAAPPSGTATFAGYCDVEGNAFNMTLAVDIPVRESCGGNPATTITTTVSGTVMVDFPAL